MLIPLLDLVTVNKPIGTIHNNISISQCVEGSLVDVWTAVSG